MLHFIMHYGKQCREYMYVFLSQMQQQELAQMRQRDANLTALAAIGPRKKRKVDSPGAPTTGSEVKKITHRGNLDVR